MKEAAKPARKARSDRCEVCFVKNDTSDMVYCRGCLLGAHEWCVGYGRDYELDKEPKRGLCKWINDLENTFLCQSCSKGTKLVCPVCTNSDGLF